MYAHGYSAATISTHAARTVDTDAAFVLSHIRPTDRILDVGCGPGSITIGLAAAVPSSSVVGVDLSEEVLAAARARAAAAGETHVVFVFPHLAGRETKAAALAELRRLLKPGGLLASRDAAAVHLYPAVHDLDRLWAGHVARAMQGQTADEEGEGRATSHFPGGAMPALLRDSGFDPGQITVGAGTTVYAGAAHVWLEERNIARLGEDLFRGSWLAAGISAAEIAATQAALKRWGDDDAGWYVAV